MGFTKSGSLENIIALLELLTYQFGSLLHLVRSQIDLSKNAEGDANFASIEYQVQWFLIIYRFESSCPEGE
jgi:hypothetical protein